jgi:putative transposase
MAIPARAPNFGTYFVSSATVGRRSIFQIEKNAQLFLDVMKRNRKHYLLHAYVVMPDHFHLILTPQEVALERVVQYLKGGFSHAYNAGRNLRLDVWQRGFTDHRVRDAADHEVRRRHIEQNPVVKGLVDSASLYPYSSANGVLTMDDYLSG